MYSIRTRSGSVGPRDSSTSYRTTSFSSRPENSPRYSRASSCDPTARSSSRPPVSMSHSYHSDYSSRPNVSPSYSSRYGSMGNLSSTFSSNSYRSPYSSSNYRSEASSRRPEPSSYRSTSDSYRTPSTYRASSTFTPRFESRLPPRDFSSSSLSKYRPESSTSYSRSNYTPSSSYSTRPRVEFRSKTPTSTEIPTRQSRFDREYKSLSRFEKTPVNEDKSDDEVENTFQKLYNRYVKEVDLEPKQKKNVVSHSEAEITTEDESASETESSFGGNYRRSEPPKRESITPRGPSPSLITPTASPLPTKKVTLIVEEKPIQSADEFRLKHSDVEMKPVVIEAKVLKPAASAMANLLKMDSLAAKVADAIHKKKIIEPELKSKSPEKKGGFFKDFFSSKTSTPPKTSVTITPKLDPISNPSKILPTNVAQPKTIEKPAEEPKNVAPEVTKTISLPPEKSPKLLSAVPLPSQKNPEVPPTNKAMKNREKSLTRRSESPNVKRRKNSVPPVTNGLPPHAKSASPSNGGLKDEKMEVLSVPVVTGSGKMISKSATPEPKKDTLTLPTGKARSSSPRPKPALTIDTKKAEEASTSVTILMGEEEMSRSVSPAAVETPRRKNRDRTRTLENMLKEVAEKNDKSLTDSPITPTPLKPPPLLLVTGASAPSTPRVVKNSPEEWGSGSGSYYGSDEDEEGWTEAEDEEDYDSDFEFCISETFRIPTKTNVYPPSIRASPFVSDYESDCSGPFLASQKWEDSRGRVDRLFAVPPPTFTCSVSYDGQESWDSESVHSCEDEEEEEEDFNWRPNSSSLAGYRSPGPFESDEDLDGAHFHDSVQVGFTLKLVDRAALKGSTESDSEYYDDEDEEYSEEEYWDEDEEEYEEEEYEEEEEQFTDEECMMSAEERSPSPTLFTASIAEESYDLDETEDAIFEADFEVALPAAIQPMDSTASKHREITYTKDLEMHMAVESVDNLSAEEKEAAKAVAKKIKKDGTTETASKVVVPLMVAPIQEEISLMEAEEVEPEALEMLNPLEVDTETGVSDVNVVPTFVRPQTEKVQEEFTSRFATSKPSTDFAKKAVIQPTKLEKVEVKETKTSDTPPKKVKTEVVKTAEKTPKTPEPVVKTTKPAEDKSSVRKSALNMKDEDAKKKAAADEEVARQKARRLGTVSALADKFKSTEEPIVYKRSSRLAPKEEEPRPRRKYEIIKPVINDEFDKQMEEIRAQMKAGSVSFQSELKNLSKGISSVTEEAKKKELEDKHRKFLDKTSGVFGMAEEEKQRWKERQTTKPTQPAPEKIKKKVEEKLEEPKKEPKRTIRRINRDKPKEEEKKLIKEEPTKVEEGSTTQPKTPPAAPPPILIDRFKRDRTPVVNPADTLKKPSTPKQDIVVDDNNLALFQAVTKVATGRRDLSKDLPRKQEVRAEAAELQAKIAQKIENKADVKLPKSDGAAATKIRNALGNVSNTAGDQQRPLKRYTTRRKTQEIVNESLQPKRKRRMVARHGKFIGNPHDIDILLGWEKQSTFEEMEKFFELEGNVKSARVGNGKLKRVSATKIWISDLTVKEYSNKILFFQDIDKIYKAAEIRDITASVD